MRKIVSTTLALAMLATSGVAFTGESEARRGHRHYERHHHHHYHYDRHPRRHRGGEAAAAIAGLALGAIIVGSTQNRYRDDGYRYRRGLSHVERCERRYRTYDRRTDTFIGYDGREYYCNL